MAIISHEGLTLVRERLGTATLVAVKAHDLIGGFFTSDVGALFSVLCAANKVLKACRRFQEERFTAFGHLVVITDEAPRNVLVYEVARSGPEIVGFCTEHVLRLVAAMLSRDIEKTKICWRIKVATGDVLAQGWLREEREREVAKGQRFREMRRFVAEARMVLATINYWRGTNDDRRTDQQDDAAAVAEGDQGHGC